MSTCCLVIVEELNGPRFSTDTGWKTYCALRSAYLAVFLSAAWSATSPAPLSRLCPHMTTEGVCRSVTELGTIHRAVFLPACSDPMAPWLPVGRRRWWPARLCRWALDVLQPYQVLSCRPWHVGHGRLRLTRNDICGGHTESVLAACQQPPVLPRLLAGVRSWRLACSSQSPLYGATGAK